MHPVRHHDLRRALVVLVPLALSVAGCAALMPGQPDAPSASLEPYEGVERLEGRWSLDQLVEDGVEASVLVVDSNLDSRDVSEVHLQKLREWIQAGGVLWVAGGGLESDFVQRLSRFDMDDFTFQKAATGRAGGELIVRGASPRMRIHDHPLTEGVDRLYLYPRYGFGAAEGIVPLVEMTDTDGEHGVVLAARPIGEGYVVLDGTVRETRTFRRMPGFDPNHPNAELTDAGWRTYDWPMLFDNAVEVAQRSLGDERFAEADERGSN